MKNVKNMKEKEKQDLQINILYYFLFKINLRFMLIIPAVPINLHGLLRE